MLAEVGNGRWWSVAKNSFVGSCCTCCRVASCASASSDSLRIGGEPNYCHSANDCAISQQSLQALQAGETKLPASWLCPHCGGAMVLIEKFTAQEIRWNLAKAR